MSKKKVRTSRTKKVKIPVRQPTDEALFVIPARLTRPFFTRLYAECEERIFERFKEQIRPVVRAVSSADDQFDSNVVTKILEREFRMNPDRIKFLIVVPTASKELSLGVAGIAKKYSVPVIALTLPFHGWPTKVGRATSTAPPVILCKSDTGTRQLARVAAMELQKKRIDRPAHVWVLPGARRIDSIWRIRGFLNGLRAEGIKLAGGKAHRLASAKWLRREAHEIMSEAIKNHLETAKVHKKPAVPVDVVFAVNDEMALGVRDAIRESNGSIETAPVTAECSIFGFDAIAEAYSLIKTHNGDKWLKGTVEQQLPLLADKLVAIMEKIRAGETNLGDEKASTKAVFHPDIAAEVAAIDAYPDDVPPFTEDNSISASVLASQGGASEQSLKKYRQRGNETQDENGSLGKDQRGMIYRIDGAGNIRYLRGSVNAVNNSRKRRQKLSKPTSDR